MSNGKTEDRQNKLWIFHYLYLQNEELSKKKFQIYKIWIYRQWMKSGTGLCWLNDAASRFMQISTLSPAMIRTAALFSSSNVCLCKDAHSSNMKSSRQMKMLLAYISGAEYWVLLRICHYVYAIIENMPICNYCIVFHKMRLYYLQWTNMTLLHFIFTYFSHSYFYVKRKQERNRIQSIC